MAANKADITILPAPVKMEQSKGYFELNEQTQIVFQTGNSEGEKTAAYLASVLRPATGYALPVNAVSDAPANAIYLQIEDVKLGEEGYRLTVGKEGVALSAATSAGLFNGVQTLRQLLPPAIFNSSKVEKQSWKIPSMAIEDYPRFAWRGMMLDTARHFLPKEFIKKFIDTLAVHKMNRLHLHLTDDQGWRIEIKKYPKLTEVGAWRKETLVGHSGKNNQTFDGKRHGGFYTQDDLRELVVYAAERHITILPEIEMPGHAQAAIASYPELGNLSEQLPVHTSWGVNKNIFNVEEHTILFLQDVLAEVVDIFPGTYIHIGGDEAVKDQWKASEAVQKRMKELGIPDEAKMQSYFIARMNEFLKSKGRKLIGWDEILEGGLGKDATVMAWRGIEKAVEAAKAGNDVVMAPTTYTYFDYYQGKKEKEPLAIGGNLPLEKVYGFDPMSIDLEPEALKHVLGTQGQVWGEYIATPDYAEYMAFPRACALAEAAWTPQAQRNYEDFLARLKAHVMRLDALGVHYRALDK
ncbi:MAG TPA: beta-N-acetylhexosaminidase [Candidatus Hydrogenedentes bacterium]|nr:beta-N-acetylhexosaminidase [Candidatus Hydrogenedentota bacterium]